MTTYLKSLANTASLVKNNAVEVIATHYLNGLWARGSTFVKTNAINLVKSGVVVIVTQIALNATRIIQEDISKATRLPSKRISDIRRLVFNISATLAILFFFKKENELFSSALKNNAGVMTLSILEALLASEPLNQFLKDQMNGLRAPGFVLKLGKTLASLDSFLHRLVGTPRSSDYKSLFAAPIIEELFYGVIIQEVLLRQLPSQALGSIISPQSITRAVSKVMRIAIRSLLFGIAHLPNSLTMRRIFSISLAGARYASLYENVNIFAAILAHSMDNFYVYFANKFSVMGLKRSRPRND